MQNQRPQRDLRMRGGRILFHPVTLFFVSWSGVVGLYSLHLSKLLLFDNRVLIRAASWVVIPFVLTVWWATAFHAVAPKKKVTGREACFDFARIEKRLHRAFWVWVACTVLEIIISGGVPIIWLIQGSSKTYFDFGIPSIHGLLNSLVLAIGLVEMGLFTIDGRKRHLRIPAFIVFWSIVVVTRNMMIVSLLEGGLAWGIMRGIRWRTVLKTTCVVMAVILVFGYMGDFRSGADEFRQLAQPSDDYPTWLPSGVLWIYIYLTTCIGNLVNTMLAATPLANPLFPNTVSLLFPSVMRNALYGAEAAKALGGELVVDSFNVSTAYVGPYQDFGYLGVVLFSIVLGLIALYTWKIPGIRGVLIYSVIGQCLVLSIFFNHLFYLPVIGQAGWIVWFLREARPMPDLDRTRNCFPPGPVELLPNGGNSV
jgi:oligosaccharide repeat unit polymerase